MCGLYKQICGECVGVGARLWWREGERGGERKRGGDRERERGREREREGGRERERGGRE